MTHNFDLVRDQPVHELASRARLWVHAQTGCELLSVENEDESKAFGIVFRTPPPDATGLPHILEHAVLSGSRRYPIKSPLGEMLKGSLATYVNALTFPDKTAYLAASQNAKDLYNLADVFLDAVFYPLLTAQTFKREGWRYELESLDGPLTLNGIVLNEQRGNFASAARLIEHHSQMPLFPDTPYGVPRGGDPAEIPSLTYERLQAYHRIFYHPSNARIFFYGNDDPEERLRYIDRWLRDFGRVEVDSTFPLQPRFDRPRRVTIPYAASAGERSDGHGRITLNWVLDEVGDPETMLALEVLEHMLVGSPASPLRAAMIDSGLGEDVTGIGLFTHVRQMYFSTGLTGVAPGDAGQVEGLIIDALRALADTGMDRDTMFASLNTIGFRLREADYGRMPRGLALLWLRATTTWIHDGDPLATLAFESPLQAILDRVEAGERYFEPLIREYLVDNTHRATVLLMPDPSLRHEDAERSRLSALRAKMREDELAKWVEDTRAFKRLQERADAPEALETVPKLTLGDLNVENTAIPIDVLETGSTTILYHDLFTGSILYLDLAFDLHTLNQELLPYVPLFGQALVEIGTEYEDHATLARRIGCQTGGISSQVLASARIASPQAVARLVLRGKATVSQADGLLEILRDMLLAVRLDNRARFTQLVREAKARLESGLLQNGSIVVGTRLGARYGEAGWLAEQMTGVSQLLFLRQLAVEVERNWPAVLSRLDQLRGMLLTQDALVCNVTVDRTAWPQLAPKVRALAASLPNGPVEAAKWTPSPLASYEGLTVPSPVKYVAKGANLYALGYAVHGSIAAITQYLRAAWLWREIRVRGGAYSGTCTFDRQSGMFTYASYRDPHLLETLDIYDRTAQFLRDTTVDKADRIKSIIGAIGRIDAYQPPGERGYTSMAYHMNGESEADRQRFRRELLSTTAEDFRAFADVLERVREQGSIVVMGSNEAISEANAKRRDGLQVTRVL